MSTGSSDAALRRATAAAARFSGSRPARRAAISSAPIPATITDIGISNSAASSAATDWRVARRCAACTTPPSVRSVTMRHTPPGPCTASMPARSRNGKAMSGLEVESRRPSSDHCWVR